MNALRIYRDDGPLADWLAGMLSAGRSPTAEPRALAWLVPPLVRLFEYGTLIAVTAIDDRGALPACFALLVVLAFHHYDTVYRMRYQGTAPPRWVRLAGGGWEGRIIVVCMLALAGVLEAGLIVAAVGLGLLYVAESAWSWRHFSDAGRPEPFGEQGDVVE
ncbi:MAG: DUF5941 domain-containing protein [Gaiellaceae bacterium]